MGHSIFFNPLKSSGKNTYRTKAKINYFPSLYNNPPCNIKNVEFFYRNLSCDAYVRIKKKRNNPTKIYHFVYNETLPSLVDINISLRCEGRRKKRSNLVKCQL